MIKTKKLRRQNKRRTKKLTNVRTKNMRRHNMRKNKTRKNKIGGASQDSIERFKNNMMSPKVKNEIIDTVSTSGLPDNTQDEILNNVNQDATVADVKQEVETLISVMQSPFNEMYSASSSSSYASSSGSVQSFENVVTLEDPSFTNETLDATPPPPLSLDDLKSLASQEETQKEDTRKSTADSFSIPSQLSLSDLERFASQQEEESQDKDIPKTIAESIFYDRYKYVLSADENALLMCLSNTNFWSIHKMLFRCIDRKNDPSEDPNLLLWLDPSKFDIVVLVHGETDPSLPPIDMHKFPNIEMDFVVPESLVVNVPFDNKPKLGEGAYDNVINKAFNHGLYIFDKYGSGKNGTRFKRYCPSVLQGISMHDDEATKNAMGIYMRLYDEKNVALFKIADFNSTYCYADYLKSKKPMTAETRMRPDDINMTFDYSLPFINTLGKLISNILTGRHNHKGAHSPQLRITQLCCRPYSPGSQKSPNIQKIYDAFLTFGGPHILMADGYTTLRTGVGSLFNSRGNIPSPQFSASQTASVMEQPDEQIKLDYIIEKLKLLANNIVMLHLESDMTDHEKNKKKIDFIHLFIRYSKMINFEFAMKGLPPPPVAAFVSLNNLDKYPDRVWKEDKPYAIGSQSSMQAAEAEEAEYDCSSGQCASYSEPVDDVSPRASVAAASPPIAAASPPIIKEAWPSKSTRGSRSGKGHLDTLATAAQRPSQVTGRHLGKNYATAAAQAIAEQTGPPKGFQKIVHEAEMKRRELEKTEYERLAKRREETLAKRRETAAARARNTKLTYGLKEYEDNEDGLHEYV